MDGRSELRDFLRTRRARLNPSDVGLSHYGRGRRVQGLRREEVAQLAGISSDYYIRLEQGRSRHVSESVIDSVADALRLDDAEREHLRDLARPARRPPVPASGSEVRPALAQVIQSIGSGPAYLLDSRLDLLAWNRLTELVFGDIVESEVAQRNMARFVFLDDTARYTFLDWPRAAASIASLLRLGIGKHPGDTRLAAVVHDLLADSDEFGRLWSDHLVADRTHGVKEFRHRAVGTFSLSYETLRLADGPGQLMMTFAAEPGSAAEVALRLLESWGAHADPAEPTAG